MNAARFETARVSIPHLHGMKIGQDEGSVYAWSNVDEMVYLLAERNSRRRDRILHALKVPDPTDLIVLEKQNLLLVSSSEDEAVACVNRRTGAIENHIYIGDYADRLFASANEQFCYVCPSDQPRLHVIDTRSRTISRTIPLGEAPSLIETHEETGSVFIVCNSADGPGELVCLDRHFKRRYSVYIGLGCTGMFFDYSRNRLIITNPLAGPAGYVCIVDNVEHHDVPKTPQFIELGICPRTILASHTRFYILCDGSKNFFTNPFPQDGSIIEVDPSSLQQESTLLLKKNPHAMLTSAETGIVFAACSDGDIAMYSPTTKATANIGVGSILSSLLLDNVAHQLIVLDSRNSEITFLDTNGMISLLKNTD